MSVAGARAKAKAKPQAEAEAGATVETDEVEAVEEAVVATVAVAPYLVLNGCLVVI